MRRSYTAARVVVPPFVGFDPVDVVGGLAVHRRPTLSEDGKTWVPLPPVSWRVSFVSRSHGWLGCGPDDYASKRVAVGVRARLLALGFDWEHVRAHPGEYWGRVERAIFGWASSSVLCNVRGALSDPVARAMSPEDRAEVVSVAMACERHICCPGTYPSEWGAQGPRRTCGDVLDGRRAVVLVHTSGGRVVVCRSCALSVWTPGESGASPGLASVVTPSWGDGVVKVNGSAVGVACEG